MKIVIEPVFEADFRPVSFGFRPKRPAHDALQVLLDESFRGKRFVVEADDWVAMVAGTRADAERLRE